jgi:hypothetical protein
LSDDIHYRLLKLLQAQPDASQRQLALALGISLGKANKLAYVYLLTPQGIDAKARITARFLKRKQAEYVALKAEIAGLTAELEATRITTEAKRGRQSLSLAEGSEIPSS